MFVGEMEEMKLACGYITFDAILLANGLKIIPLSNKYIKEKIFSKENSENYSFNKKVNRFSDP